MAWGFGGGGRLLCCLLNPKFLLSLPQCSNVTLDLIQPQKKPSGVKFPIHFGVALKELFSSPGRCIQASKLAASNDEDRQCILTTLWAEGLIRVAL